MSLKLAGFDHDSPARGINSSDTIGVNDRDKARTFSAGVRTFYRMAALALCFAGLSLAQSHAGPGQTADSVPAQPMTLSIQNELPGSRSWRTLYVLSAAGVVTASLLDLRSSLNKREANPLMTGAGGLFAPGSAAMTKAGTLAAIFGFQTLMRHRCKGRLEKSFAIINFIATGAITAVIIHNYRVPVAR
jgi:hypothetical protein